MIICEEKHGQLKRDYVSKIPSGVVLLDQSCMFRTHTQSRCRYLECFLLQLDISRLEDG